MEHTMAFVATYFSVVILVAGVSLLVHDVKRYMRIRRRVREIRS